MRKAFAVSLALAVTGILMTGLVESGMDLGRPLPMSTFLGFFQHFLYATERFWSAAHGWSSWSHVDDFGRFYAHAVSFGCPLLGFLVHVAVSHPKIGRNLLTPIAIAISQISPLTAGIDYPLRAIGLTSAAVYIARAMVVLLMMIWSSGAFRAIGHATPSKQVILESAS